MAELSSMQNCRQYVVNISAAGDNLVVSNATSPIIVYGLTVVAAGATQVTLKNGSPGIPLTGPIDLVAGGSIDFAPTFDRFVVGAGTGAAGGLYINLSSAVQVSGVCYVKFGK